MRIFIKCKRCGKAKNLQFACPHCGFQPVEVNLRVLLTAAIIGGAPIAFSILMTMHDRPKDPKILKKLEAIQDIGVAAEHALTAAVMLKKSIPDPDYVELNSVVVDASGTVCFRYRAKNSIHSEEL